MNIIINKSNNYLSKNNHKTSLNKFLREEIDLWIVEIFNFTFSIEIIKNIV